MQAVILAAGMGRRLGELTRSNTKCMVRVNGVPLIERMLSQLERRRLDRIVMVIGYCGRELKEYVTGLKIATPVVWVENPVYDRTNNIYSLYLARHYLVEQDTLLLESDLIFEDAVLDRLADHPHPTLALVARFESWMDGTVVTLDERDNIRNFIPPGQFSFEEIPSYFKTVNIYKFSRHFSATHYVPFLEAYSKALGNNEYYEQVLRVITLLEGSELKALRLDGEAWYEIDDIQDLDIAESIFAGDSLKRIASRYGGYWRYPQMLDYCYLVNPYFPNPKLLAEIKANFERLVTRYPSGMKVNSLLAAKNFRLRPEWTAVGNGAAELIKSLMERTEGKIGITYPTFEEYPNRRSPESVVPFIPDNADFSYSARDLVRHFSGKGIRGLLLVNPDNPSGNFLPFGEVVELCEWTQREDIAFILDESFVDFSDGSEENSLLRNDMLERFPHLAVVKSVSKSYGVLGLRLGILASADTRLIGRVREDAAIWNINSFAEFYMQIYGKYESDYRAACRTFIAERERFGDELRTVPWLRVIPSEANYFLCEVTDRFTSTELAEKLLKRNILIKDCASKKAFRGKNYVRIAVRDRRDNGRFIHCLKSL